jgi:hypothetical protein
MQYTAANNGNPTMMIWLGKQYLGQKDKTESEITGKDGAPLIPVRDIPDEEIEKRAREILSKRK